MKKLFFVLLLVVFSSLSFSQHFDHLFELRGMEDYNNNTHFYYRYGLLFNNAIDCWWKPLHHFDLFSGVDSVFFLDAGSVGWLDDCRGYTVNDVDFFESDPKKYILGGGDYFFDWVPLLIRYDGEVHLETLGFVNKIEISKQNDSLVYVSAFPLFKSTDKGYNFERLDSTAFVDNPMISLSVNDESQIYGIDNNMLLRSEDEGRNYQTVDEDERWNGWGKNYNLYYDPDGQHIYGVCVGPSESALIFSDSNGDSSSWNTLLAYNGYLSFAHDNLKSGEVFYSIGKKIFNSTDFGNTFKLLTEFNNNVMGVYKKPGTEILYAATLSNIYKITPDTISIVLSKPHPSYISYHYPLSIGNVWVYDQTVYEAATSETINSYYKKSITDEINMSNGKTYYKLSEYDAYLDSTNIFYERIDPISFKLFRYAADSVHTNQEYLLDDLFVLLGDTVKAYRYFPNFSEDRITIYHDASPFRDFGLQFAVPRIQFNTYSGTNNEFNYFLTFAIGLDSFYINKSDLYTATFDLKGFIIDGILHGDTTTVSVEDETSMFPSEFSLLQNYPNPFNPSTTIRYEIPERSFVTIQVYDILGNEITTLVNEEKPAGSYEVEFSLGRDSSPDIASGIYFYRLQAGNFVETKKMVLLR